MSRWFRSSKQEADLVPTKRLALSASGPQDAFSTGLKKLFEGNEAIVDLVFVHGLTGHRERTWTTSGAHAPWMSTILPLDLPDSRIFTFGYDANVVDWRSVVSQSRVGNHATNLLNAVATHRENDGTAERPLIFIAHSMGGLVCADMLVSSRQRTELHLQRVCRATRGVVFLGTPHQGSSLAPWAEALAKSIGVLKQTNTKILTVLQKDSEVLARIQDSFHALVRDRSQSNLPSIEISCFYEELPVPGVGSIVTPQSAIVPGYTAIGIHQNHIDMTKFSSRSDPGYIAVVGELRRWVRQLDHQVRTTNTLEMYDETLRTPLAVSAPTPPCRLEQDHLGSSHHGTSSKGRRIDSDLGAMTSPRKSGIFVNEPSDYRGKALRGYAPTSGFGRDRSSPSMPGQMKRPLRGVQLPLGQRDGLDLSGASLPPLSLASQVFEVPLPQNPHFTGQEVQLQILNVELDAYIRSNYTSLHRLILTGMGGIGKTELSVQFANSNKRKFHAVFWADATTQNSLNSSFKQSCRSLIRRRQRRERGSRFNTTVSHVHLPDTLFESLSGQADDASFFLDWLGGAEKPWLLVIDNMDDPDMVPALESKIRHLDAGFILVTSRNQRAARLGTLVELGVLPINTCAEMLLRATQRWTQRTEEDEVHSKILVERLGCLPLAIDQAAAYIMSCQLPIDEYIDLFERHTDYLLGKPAENRYHSTKTEYSDGKYDTVLKTWELSFNFVIKDSPAAGELLQLFAFMNPEYISESLFAKFTFPRMGQWNVGGRFEEINPGELCVPETLAACLGDHNEYKDACATLLRFSLVKRRVGGGSQSLWIHPLIHYWISSRMSEAEKFQWLRLTASFLSISLPARQQRPALGNAPESTKVYHHLRSIFEASRKLKIVRPVGCLPHILYALPYSNNIAESRSIVNQLYSMSAIAGDRFLQFTTQLWELTDTCCRKPLCQQESLRVIGKALSSVTRLHREPSTRRSGGFNALLFQLAFQLGLTFETEPCDCQHKHLDMYTCVAGLKPNWLPFIQSIIFEWRPVNPNHDKQGTFSLENEPHNLRWIYLVAITRPAKIIDSITTTETRLLSEFGAYPMLRVPIVSRLLDLAEQQDRPIEDSVKSLKSLMKLADGTKHFSSRLADMNARTFDRMIVHPDTMLDEALEPQVNAMRWREMKSFLSQLQAWEEFVGVHGSLMATQWTNQWSRFLSAFNQRLGLNVDPTPFFRERKDKTNIETNEPGTTQALFGNYKAPTSYHWTIHVVDFLKGFQDDLSVREKAIQLLLKRPGGLGIT